MTIHLLRTTEKSEEINVTDVNRQLAEGSLSAQTLAWCPGLPRDWIPLSSRMFRYHGIRHDGQTDRNPLRKTSNSGPDPRVPRNSSLVKTDDEGRTTHDYGSLVDCVPQLPTLPSVIMELTSLLQDSHDVHADRITGIVKQDQSLTTHVLRVANLSYYAGCEKARTVNGAIRLLGFEKVKRISLASTLFSKLGVRRAEAFAWKQFWKHSIGVGIASSALAKSLGHDDHEVFFTAGLLHDLGKVISFLVDPEAMTEVVTFAMEKKISMIESERACGAPEHNRMGEELCKRWKLPEVITKVIANHHEENTFYRSLEPDSRFHKYVDVVILANHCIHELEFGFSGHRDKKDPSKELMERLGWSSEDLPELLELIRGELDEGGGLLDMLED